MKSQSADASLTQEGRKVAQEHGSELPLCIPSGSVRRVMPCGAEIDGAGLLL